MDRPGFRRYESHVSTLSMNLGASKLYIGVNVCFHDFDDNEFPYMFGKRMKQETERRISNQFAFRDLLAKIGHEIRNKTSEMKEKLKVGDFRNRLTKSVDRYSVKEPNKVNLDVEDENSRSNVPIGRPSKRKRVEYDETNLGYAHWKSNEKEKIKQR
ncbi:hypothetical protein Tco_1300794 [Tanacetum coccineum]